MSSSTSRSRVFLNAPLRLFIVWSSVVLFAFFVWSSNEARKNTANRVIDWLPSGTKELRDFYYYYYLFPEGELLMISWTGCDRNDSRLDDVAAKLLAPPENGVDPFFERVLTTRSVLEELTEDPINLSRADARSRLSGWLIGKDGQTACLVALISRSGEQRRAEAIRYVFSTVKEITDLPESEIHVAGPTIDSVAIDAISERSQKVLLPFFLALCLILLLCCLRHFFPALIVFGVSLMNEELGGTLLYWTGAHVDSISMLISSLVYVLTISAGVHLVNYYRETLQETDTVHAPLETVRKAFLPCSLAVETTVLGLGSLMVSKMIPIRTFGLYSSIALVLGVTWLFIVVTAMFQQYPIRSWARKEQEKSENGKKQTNEAEENRLATPAHDRWGIFAGIVERGKYPISIIALAFMIFFSFGVQYLRTTVTFHGMLPKTAKVIQDYEVLEDNIGGLIPVEIVLQVPDTGNEKPTLLDHLYLLQEMEASLQTVDGIGCVVSALNFTPQLPSRTEKSFGATARRRAMNRLLGSRLELLKEARFYNRTEAGQDNGLEGPDHAIFETSDTFWRMSLRISSRAPIDYEVLLKEIRHRLEEQRKNGVGTEFVGLDFNVTGGVPLVHRAQQQLLEDLIESFVTAFGLIALTMILMLRGIVRGLLAMIPNIFPCILIFGALGWLDWRVDMGSMMTASVAMGIAVDGTLHYLTWFNIGLRKGMSRREAVFSAYRCCATALTQTTIICGFGMLVFGFSDFVPVSRFAVMMCLLLTASLIGDIVVLPAILLSPLGRFFEPRKRPDAAIPEQAPISLEK